MKKEVTIDDRNFHVKYSESDGKWEAVVIELPPTNDQLYTLPSPWSCAADTEEDLNKKLNQYFQKMHK